MKILKEKITYIGDGGPIWERILRIKPEIKTRLSPKLCLLSLVPDEYKEPIDIKVAESSLIRCIQEGSGISEDIEDYQKPLYPDYEIESQREIV
jgi:hypothetical protein